MKKILALILALVMCLSLVACGGGSADKPADKPADTGSSAPAEKPAEKPVEPVTLKFQGAWAQSNSAFYFFDTFCELVEEYSNGTLKVVWGAGPEAIPSDQLAEAMQNGIVELVLSPCTYLVTHAPILRGVKLTEVDEMRANGGTEYLNEIANKVLNSQWLAYTNVNSRYTLAVSKEIKSLDDFKGLVIRGTAAHKPVIAAVGAEMTSMGWGDVYSALERNVITGCGGTYKDYVDNGLADKIGYVIEPGFYQNDSSLFCANHIWEKLDDVQKEALLKAAMAWEEDAAKHYPDLEKEHLAQLAADGATILTFEGELLEQFTKAAYDAGWAEVEAVDPEGAAKLRSFTNN